MDVIEENIKHAIRQVKNTGSTTNSEGGVEGIDIFKLDYFKEIITQDNLINLTGVDFEKSKGKYIKFGWSIENDNVNITSSTIFENDKELEKGLRTYLTDKQKESKDFEGLFKIFMFC